MSNLGSVSNYTVEFSGDAGAAKGEIWRHLGADGAWELVRRAIGEVFRRR